MIKKGQSAMEFLMTYGWAIIAAIVAMGALAYFGAFNSDKSVTGRAIVNAPFHINEWNVKSSLGTDGGVNLELKNGGEDYNLYTIDISGCGTLDLSSAPQLISAGSMPRFQILCSPGIGLTEGNTFRGDIEITYRKIGSSLNQISKGSITKKITA